MPDKRLLELARDARDRAEEILAKAETFKDAYAKQQMRKIAVKYEKLAEQLEKAAADEPQAQAARRAAGWRWPVDGVTAI